MKTPFDIEEWVAIKDVETMWATCPEKREALVKLVFERDLAESKLQTILANLKMLSYDSYEFVCEKSIKELIKIVEDLDNTYRDKIKLTVEVRDTLKHKEKYVATVENMLVNVEKERDIYKTILEKAGYHNIKEITSIQTATLVGETSKKRRKVLVSKRNELSQEVLKQKMLVGSMGIYITKLEKNLKRYKKLEEIMGMLDNLKNK